MNTLTVHLDDVGLLMLKDLQEEVRRINLLDSYGIPYRQRT